MNDRTQFHIRGNHGTKLILNFNCHKITIIKQRQENLPMKLEKPN